MASAPGPGAHCAMMIIFLTVAVAVEAVALLCVVLGFRSAHNEAVLSISLLMKWEKDNANIGILLQNINLLFEMQKLDRKRIDDIEFELREPIAAQAALMGLDPAKYVRHQKTPSADVAAS